MGIEKARKRKLTSVGFPQTARTPPLPGELKMNFDAAYHDGQTVTGVILRNNNRVILGAWTSHFVAENAFCAEIEVVLQALEMAFCLRLKQIPIEGDAFSVVMAMHGLEKYEDWQAKHNILKGRDILTYNLF